MPVIRNFLPYTKARDFVRSLGLKNAVEWLEYCKKDKPSNIPSNSSRVYKDCGWISWMEWLGTNNKRGGNRRHKVNDNYFKTWSCNEAYILGFWFSDGCIGKYKGSYMFSISQHARGKDLLEEMLKEMKSDYHLYFDKKCNCYWFKIVSKTIYDDIIKLGGKPRKSLDVKFPYIPNKYLPDFIRGLWDGDGSIFYNKDGKSYISSYSSASKELIDGLFLALKNNIPNLGSSVRCDSKNNYELRFSKNDTIRLKKFMYQEPLDGKLMLKRKYDLFLKTPDECGRVSYREFLNYNDSKNFIKSFGFKSKREWRRYCKAGNRPRNIPSAPNIVYKNLGWVDWHDWLGISKDKTKK